MNTIIIQQHRRNSKVGLILDGGQQPDRGGEQGQNPKSKEAAPETGWNG